MPTEILIFSRRNGRALKTYGVKRPDNIMKFTFICIVVVLLCDSSVSGDLDIYPRWRYNFGENRNYRFKKYEAPDLEKFRFPLPINQLKDTDIPFNTDTDNIAERLNQFKNFQERVDYERIKLMQQNPRDDLDSRFLQRFAKDRSHDIIPLNLLEEARVYSQDDDLDFVIDDNAESNIHDILDQPKYGDEMKNGEDTSVNKDEMENMYHDMGPNDDENTEDETSRRFQKIKIMDDPSEFAYDPSDFRFYRKSDDDSDDFQTPQSTNIQTPIRTSNGISVTYRSELKQQQMKIAHPEEEATETSHRIGGTDVVEMKPSIADMDTAGVYVIAIVAGISAAATVGLIAVGIGWYNLQKHVKNASDAEYPSYGITGPNKDISPSGDRRLAQSAQMYHYQHQKQQIIAMESAQPSFAISRAQPGERHGSVSEADSDEENEEGDYTVYECPGLAPTGEMEVKNPLFQDDPTPAQTPALKNTADEKK